MKQMKRIMALLLCAVMVLSNLPMTALAAGAAAREHQGYQGHCDRSIKYFHNFSILS